jgi:precorrin-3B synthase
MTLRNGENRVRGLGVIEGDRVERRSACPGLFRMTPARDGGICRVKLSCGRLTSTQARAVADVADRYGNGIIELTNRANLQLRGIAENDANSVILALMEAGLGPLTPEGDDIRNVMVSPTAGIDTALAVDTLPLAETLLHTLQTTPAYYALSPKSSILIDGGEACAVTSHTSDIWLAASADGERFVFGLASCPPEEAPSFPLAGKVPAERADGGGDECAFAEELGANVSTPIRPLTRAPSPHGGRRGPVLGMVAAEHAHALVTTILDLFLEISAQRPGIVRMKHLITEMPESDFLGRLRHRLSFPIEDASEWRRPAPRAFAHLGIHARRQRGLVYAGAAVPLGRLDPDRLRALADITVDTNTDEIRLTPWQSILLPDIAEDRAADILTRMNNIGLVSDPDAPLASMIACSGSTGCASAMADTQADGAKLARLLENTGARPVHLTGCPKSCAAIRPAPATLVAVSDGRYDLFLRENITGPSRFGELLAANVTIEEAARMLVPHAGK